MNDTKQKGLGKRLFPLFLVTATNGLYNIVWLPVVFYVPFQQVFQLTNTQMGLILAFYSAISTPALLVNGWLCDRFNPKTLLVISCISSSLLGLSLMVIPSYSVINVIYMLLAASIGLLQWAPQVKCIRLLGTNEEQGRLFGISGAIDGVLSFAMCVGLAALLGDSISTPSGFRLLVMIMCGFYLVCGILLIPFFDYKSLEANIAENYGQSSGEKVTIKSYFSILKMPITWIMVLLSFGLYAVTSTSSYLSPFLNSVFALPAAWAVILASVMKQGLRMIGAPAGGYMRDKMGGKTSPLIYICVVVGIASLVIMMLIPWTASYTIPIIAVALIFSFFMRVNSVSANLPLAELNPPLHLVGSIVGLSTSIGFCSDLFLPALNGRILDTYGNNGFYGIFVILIISLLICAVAGVWLQIEVKKMSK